MKMKTITKKVTGNIARISLAFALIAGMAVCIGSVKVHAQEVQAVETQTEVTQAEEMQAEAVSTEGTITGEGWTINTAGVLTLTQDISDEVAKNDPGYWQYSTQVKEVVVAEGVTRVPWCFLSNYAQWTNVRKVTLSSTVKTIGIAAFDSCPNLEEVNLNEGLEEIGHNSFFGASFSEIHLPSTLKTIEDDAFEDCDNLRTVTIPGSVEFIWGKPFFSCDNLEEVIFEEGNLKDISLDIFQGCANIKYIWIPKSLEEVEGAVKIKACLIGYKGSSAEKLASSEYGTKFASLTFHAIDGDEHSGDWQTVTEATCTEKGLQKQVCTICHTEQTREIAAAGHAWDKGKVTKEPTAKAEGIRTYTCTVCGTAKTEAIAKLASSEQKNATSPETGDTVGGLAWLLVAMAVAVGTMTGLRKQCR